ncbi:hypothetical protein [Cellulomonas taurus]|uniref:hypothetical protein n=1 Tax=Cellulomonas taurus TaxID=2729175 RepID=UPI00145D4E42|nr:hypothetical protein [Cellulomonas taurus]
MIDPTTIIVAVLGLIGTVLGMVYKRRGEARQEDSQAAANRLTARDNEFDRLEALNTRLEAENSRLSVAVDRSEAARRADQERCSTSQAGLITTVTTLTGVVRDEVAKEMARIAVERAKRHETTDH